MNWNLLNPNSNSCCRTAGTVGAVVTCPLEVVKTRLQSSTAFLPAQPSNGTKGRLQVSTSITSTTSTNSSLANAASGPGTATVNSDGRIKPDQRRRLCTTILRKRPPQVTAIAFVNYYAELINTLISGYYDIFLRNVLIGQVNEYCAMPQVSPRDGMETNGEDEPVRVGFDR